MHAGRVFGYSLAGLFEAPVMMAALLSTVAIVSGNHLGALVRAAVQRLPEGVLEHAVLVTCVTLSAVGLR
jgi:hypothetical protein